MRHRRGWLGWVLAVGALLPAQARAQDAPSVVLGLPLLALEEQGAPVGFDCAALADRKDLAGLDDPAQPPTPEACAGALGFSAAGASGSRFGWFGALGKFRYLAALPALLAVSGGGGGGGGGGGAPAKDGDVALPPEREPRAPYSNPIPEPASTALFVSGALLVAGAVRRRSR